MQILVNMTSRQLRLVHWFAVPVMALVFAVSVQAGTSRTFVSTTGNDSNTAVNCSPAAPCRTFAAALSVTNSGGELVVLSSGGYGPVTITQPVIITAIGIDASISAVSGGNGITIDTAGNVTLIGLNLHGEGVGTNGVSVEQVGFLRLYNMLVENFANIGVDLEVTGKMAVYDSVINDNGNFGLRVNSATATAYVHNSSFDGNVTAGAAAASGQLTIADSSSSNNGNGFRIFGAGATMTLINDRAEYNGSGLFVDLGGSMYFAGCLIANNTASYTIPMGTLSGTSPGTNLITPGQSTSGTLSTPITLQ